MWKNTIRTKLNIKKQANDKTLVKPPFSGANFILPGGIGGWNEYGPAISEITYFTILRVLSEAMGKIPVHVRDRNHNIVENSTEKLITVRPNSTMSPVQLFSYVEYCRNHYGNGYIYCNWSNADGKLKSITALDPRGVRVWIDDVSNDILQQHYYTYTAASGNSYILPAEDVVHVKAWHVDDQTRLIGIPVRETLRAYMDAAQAAQDLQTSLYRNGYLSSGVLNYVGDLSDEKKQLLLEQIKKIGTKNKIIPLPKDWELKPIDLNLVNSQYLEGRKLTANQVAAAFGVPSSYLNDLTKASYSNATAQQLQFLTDTLLYILRQYSSELNYKLLSDKEIDDGLRIEFDTDAMLQTTPDVLSDILTKYVTGSIMTINEARDKCGLPSIDGGDKLMTMPGATTLEKEVIV